MTTEIIPDNYQPPSSDEPRGPLERSVAALQRMERRALLTGRVDFPAYEAPRSDRLSGAARKRREWQRRIETQQARAAARLARAQAAARGEPQPETPKVLRGRQGVKQAQG